MLKKRLLALLPWDYGVAGAKVVPFAGPYRVAAAQAFAAGAVALGSFGAGAMAGDSYAAGAAEIGSFSAGAVALGTFAAGAVAIQAVPE